MGGAERKPTVLPTPGEAPWPFRALIAKRGSERSSDRRVLASARRAKRSLPANLDLNDHDQNQQEDDAEPGEDQEDDQQ